MRNNVPRQTSEPRPEPVVVAVQEPVQDPGENRAVVVGDRLLLRLQGGQAEAKGTGEEEEEEEEERGEMRRNNILALVKLQDVKPDTLIVIN